jgi:O-antigen ligase
LALLVVASAVVLVAGVLASGSVAGYALLGPTALVSAVIYFNRPFGPSIIVLTVVGLVVLGAFGAWLAASELPAILGVSTADADALSRPQVFERTLKAASDHWPWGTGIGSFERVYPSYEDASVVTNVYTNRVHNDYFELALEVGLPGLVLLGLIIVLIVVRGAIVWASAGQDSRLKKAAAAGLVVILIHSSVDYPLRTLSIAVVAAVFVGLLMQSSKRPATSDLSVVNQHKQLVL